MKTTEYSASTRPRSSGGAASCRLELTPVAKVTLAAPRATSTATWTASVGAAAAASSATPNRVAATTSRRGDTRPRAPLSSAPATDPAPIALVSSA